MKPLSMSCIVIRIFTDELSWWYHVSYTNLQAGAWRIVLLELDEVQDGDVQHAALPGVALHVTDPRWCLTWAAFRSLRVEAPFWMEVHRLYGSTRTLAPRFDLSQLQARRLLPAVQFWRGSEEKAPRRPPPLPPGAPRPPRPLPLLDIVADERAEAARAAADPDDDAEDQPPGADDIEEAEALLLAEHGDDLGDGAGPDIRIPAPDASDDDAELLPDLPGGDDQPEDADLAVAPPSSRCRHASRCGRSSSSSSCCSCSSCRSSSTAATSATWAWPQRQRQRQRAGQGRAGISTIPHRGHWRIGARLGHC